MCWSLRTNDDLNISPFTIKVQETCYLAHCVITACEAISPLMYAWRCITCENDQRYQLDATIVINYHKYLYMFRASICPSSGISLVFVERSERNTDSPNITLLHTVTYPGILFGGCSTNSVEDRGQRERGSGGGSPLVRGSGGSCNLVQEISFHIVKFS